MLFFVFSYAIVPRFFSFCSSLFFLFSNLLNQSSQRLIENQLQGIGVVFFNSPSMIRNLKPEIIHLMLQLAAITSPNLYEISFMLASMLSSFEDFDKSIEVYKQIPIKHYLGEYAAIQISNLYSLEDNNKEAIKQLESFLKTNKTFEKPNKTNFPGSGDLAGRLWKTSGHATAHSASSH